MTRRLLAALLAPPLAILWRLLLPWLHALARDPRFRHHPLLRSLRQTPQEQMMDLAMYYARTSRLEGDYLEFGVYRGDSLCSAYHHARLRQLDSMRFFAFDSFSGLPSPGGVDLEGFAHFAAGDYACSLDEVKARLRREGVDPARVFLVPGLYQEVLGNVSERLPIGKAAVVMIDCDLYESTVPVLEFLTGRVQDGTVLMFDDWFAYRGDPQRGQQRAWREWLARHPELSASAYHPFAVCGMSFIVHRRSAPA